MRKVRLACWSLALAAFTQQSCHKQPCQSTSDCARGLTCHPAQHICVDPTSLVGTTGGGNTAGTTGGTTGSTTSSTTTPPAPVAPAADELIITEVAAQPSQQISKPVTDHSLTPRRGELEFVEIFNTTADKRLDLTGIDLVIVNGTSETVHTLSGVVEPHSRIVVARNADLLLEYYPGVQTLSQPNMRLNDVVRASAVARTNTASMTFNRGLQAKLRNAAATLLDATKTFGGQLHNYYLPEPYPATSQARKDAWGVYDHFEGVTGDRGQQPNVESWGTPGAANLIGGDPSPLSGKLAFAQWSAGAAVSRQLYLVGIGAKDWVNSPTLIEIRNISTETIDVMGMVLDQASVRGPKTLHSNLVIGRSPIKANSSSKSPGTDTSQRVHLNLAPGDSVVLARSAAAVSQVLVDKKQGGLAKFVRTVMPEIDSQHAFRITNVPGAGAGYHGGFIITGNILQGEGRHGYAYLTLRDRQGLVIDQAGGPQAINGFRRFTRGIAWHSNLTQPRSLKANWSQIGLSYWEDHPYTQCGDTLGTTGARPCFLIGLVMEDVQ